MKSLLPDTDWGGDSDDRHSTTGNVFILTGGAVSWLSKKQAVVALSTSEAEYMALSSAVQEALWLQKLFTDLQMTAKLITIKEDNQGAIALTQNPITHSRTISYVKQEKMDLSISYIFPLLR